MIPTSDNNLNNQWINHFENIIQPSDDGGFNALLLIAHFFHIPIEAQQLYQSYGKTGQAFTENDIIREALHLGLLVNGIDGDMRPAKGCPFILITEEKQFWVNLPDQTGFIDPINQLITEKVTVKKGCRLLYFKKKLASNEKKKSISLSWFWPMIKKHKTALWRILMASIVIQSFALILPKCFQVIVDKVLVHHTQDTLMVITLVMITLALYEPILTFIRAGLFAHLSSCFSVEVFSKIFQHLLQLPLAFFRQQPVGNLIGRIRELDHVRNFIASSALMAVTDIIFIGVFIAVLFSYSSLLAWIICASLFIMIIIWSFMAPLFKQKVENHYHFHANNIGHLTEMISGIETIKTSATEKNFLAYWQEKLSLELNSHKKVQYFAFNLSQVIGLIQKISSIAIIGFGTHLVMEEKLSVGSLIAFNMLAGHVTLPILRMAQLWQDFQSSQTALKRLSYILDTKAEITTNPLANIPEIEGKITFNDVFFRYHETSRDIFHRLNFTIAAGTCIGITGRSGAGKSTISKLIQKLYTPQKGDILIDDVHLNHFDNTRLRNQIGVVQQESALFNGSIMDNLALANPLASATTFKNALTLSGVDDLVAKLPAGLDTQVGEKGQLLSGGQKQRVAIARALMNDPKILILDEATAALDFATEFELLAQINTIKQNRTVIIIAHRLNTLKQCDKILVFDEGSIKEQGSHQQLLEQKGLYYQTNQSQR